MSELAELISEIQDIADEDEYDMKFNTGATNDEILKFEKMNGVKFPDLVKEWLLFTDGCCLFNTTVQLYGVAHKPCVTTTPKGISGKYIGIGKFNFGDNICFLDKSQKIFQCGESIIEYDDFKKFLEAILEIGQSE